MPNQSRPRPPNIARQRVLNKVLNFLSYRPRSIFEVTQRLSRYTSSAALQQELITYLVETGLLDDLAFAKFWLESRKHKKSSRLLAYELKLKQVPSAIISQALQALVVDDTQNLHKFLQTKFAPSMLVDPAQRAKLTRYIQARGFSYSDLQKVLQKLKEEC